jgi:hypothetical protein
MAKSSATTAPVTFSTSQHGKGRLIQKIAHGMKYAIIQ